MIQAGANIPSTLKSTETLRSAKWESSSIFGKPYRHRPCFSGQFRQGLFNVQAFVFGPVGAMLKGASPVDAALVQKEALRLQVTSSMITEMFKVDTRKFQTHTHAKDKIWDSQADFTKKADDLHEAAMTLEAAAKKGEKSGILDAAGKVGNACKACHDEYREK
jgi:cytochrome c556